MGTECHTEVQENGLPELKIDPAIYYAVSRDGSRFESPVKIPVPMKEGDGLWEPHACLMPSGRVVLAVRVQTGMDCQHLICRCSYSDDGGRTYAPFRDVEGFGGPPHLCPVGEGRVVLTYGYRFSPYGIRARLSVDNGETFGEEFILCDDLSDQDLGYPATILCRDGAFLTVYYGRREEEKNTGVYYVRWRLSEE